MIPPRLVLPPGRCLTDIWDHLTPRQRTGWLRLVEREACTTHSVAAASRVDDLERAVAGYRVGRPRRRRTP